jgi:hypothetical protein
MLQFYKLVLLSVFFVRIMTTSSVSNAEIFGIGAVIGDPTGVSAKMWLDKTTAIDGAFAWSMAGQNAIHVQGDYLIHQLSFFHLGKLPMNLYYGAGARISSYSGKSKTGLGLGARAPLGMAYEFKKPSVELFAEVALILELTPSTEGLFNIGIGGRYYF